MLNIKDGERALFYKIKNRHFTTMVQAIVKMFCTVMHRVTLNPIWSYFDF